MSKHDDGGLAFPMATPTPEIEFDRGMTLFDYYVGQSLTGYRGLPGSQAINAEDIAKLAGFDAEAAVAEKRRRENAD